MKVALMFEDDEYVEIAEKLMTLNDVQLAQLYNYLKDKYGIFFGLIVDIMNKKYKRSR